MEISDIQAIWTRIKELHPHTPAEKRPRLTRETAELWRKVLTGYELATVLDAVERQRAKKPYWPDLSEIVAELPPPPPSRTHLIKGADAGDTTRDDLVGWYRQRLKVLEDERRAVGVPANITEARAAGMSALEWFQLLESHGLNVCCDLDFT